MLNSRVSYQQCTKCERYLVGSDTANGEHVSRCYQTSSSNSITDRPETLEVDCKPLRWKEFPNLRIVLEKCQPPETQLKPIGTGEKLSAYIFDCKLCPGKFYSMVEYNRHMNVHNGTRKIITCIICLRMFNKRDSLNSHYAAHQTAEEKEASLLHSPWKKYKYSKDNPYARSRHACKYCLLVHHSQYSYVEHIKTEHADVKSFPCRLDKCPLNFKSIKEVLDHSKSEHRLSFYGRWTIQRMEEDAITEYARKSGLLDGLGKDVINPVDMVRKTTKKTSGTNGTRNQKNRRKRKKRKSESSEYESDDGVLVESVPVQCSEGNRIVELERVHIVNDGCDAADGNVIVKPENPDFYEIPDPVDANDMAFLFTQPETSSGESKSGLDLGLESIPVVVNCKLEFEPVE